MKKKILTLLTCIMLLLSITMPTFAETINSATAKAGETLEIKDTINGIGLFTASDLTISGVIDGVSLLLGQKINLTGDVLFPFAAAEDLNLSGNVSKDFFAAGRNIKIDENATIGRDTFVAGQNITIAGKVDRNMYIACETLTIKETAIINGNILADIDNIIIEQNAVVNGEIKYNNNVKTTEIDEGKYNVTVYETKDDNDEDIEQKETFMTKLITVLKRVISNIVIFAVLMLICGSLFDKSKEKLTGTKSYFGAFFIGIATIILLPILIVILWITKIGLALGIILFALYLIGFIVAYIVAVYAITDIIISKAFNKELNKYLVGIIGLAVAGILEFVPFIPFAIMMIGYGMLLKTIESNIQAK